MTFVLKYCDVKGNVKLTNLFQFEIISFTYNFYHVLIGFLDLMAEIFAPETEIKMIICFRLIVLFSADIGNCKI